MACQVCACACTGTHALLSSLEDVSLPGQASAMPLFVAAAHASNGATILQAPKLEASTGAAVLSPAVWPCQPPGVCMAGTARAPTAAQHYITHCNHCADSPHASRLLCRLCANQSKPHDCRCAAQAAAPVLAYRECRQDKQGGSASQQAHTHCPGLSRTTAAAMKPAPPRPSAAAGAGAESTAAASAATVAATARAASVVPHQIIRSRLPRIFVWHLARL